MANSRVAGENEKNKRQPMLGAARVDPTNQAYDQNGPRAEPIRLANSGTLDTQAAALGNVRLPSAQRQALAAQIGKVHGNGHLQRLVESLAVQRDDEDGGEEPPPARQDVEELDYAFVFATDTYGQEAQRFIRAEHPEHRIVSARSFEEMFDRLWTDMRRPHPNRRLHLRELIIVTHANSAGGMKIGLTRGDYQRGRFFTPWDLADLQQEFRQDLHQRFRQRRSAVVEGIIDEDTTVVVRGCEVGQSEDAVEGLRAFFGGEPRVWAPRSFQGYESLPIGRSALQTPEEAYDFLVQQGRIPVSDQPVSDEEKRAYIASTFGLQGSIPAEFFVVGQEAHDVLAQQMKQGQGRTEEAEELKERESVGIPNLGDRVEAPYYLPQIGSATEVTIDAWLKQPGERIDRERPFLRVSTGESVYPVNPTYSGVLNSVLAEPGDTVAPKTVIANIGFGAWALSEPSLMGSDTELDGLSIEEIEARARSLNDPYRPQNAHLLRRLRAAWERKMVGVFIESNDPLAGLPPESIFGDSNITAMDAARYPGPETPHADLFEEGTLAYGAPAPEQAQQAREFQESEALTQPAEATPEAETAGGGGPAPTPTPEGERRTPTEEQRRAARDFSKTAPPPEPVEAFMPYIHLNSDSWDDLEIGDFFAIEYSIVNTQDPTRVGNPEIRLVPPSAGEVVLLRGLPEEVTGENNTGGLQLHATHPGEATLYLSVTYDGTRYDSNGVPLKIHPRRFRDFSIRMLAGGEGGEVIGGGVYTFEIRENGPEGRSGTITFAGGGITGGAPAGGYGPSAWSDFTTSAPMRLENFQGGGRIASAGIFGIGGGSLSVLVFYCTDAPEVQVEGLGVGTGLAAGASWFHGYWDVQVGELFE